MSTAANSVWDKAQGYIKDKIGSTAFETWFGSIQVKAGSATHLVLEVPDTFFKDWVLNHYYNLIQEAINQASGGSMQLEISVNPKLLPEKNKDRLQEFKTKIQEPGQESIRLNPRYSFDSFVVGSSNRFAHAASLAVAESPAKAYNPLFLYGGVGLGKTHLMQATAQYINRQQPQLKISYITSERFTNELIDAIQHRSTQRFRLKYRNVDVLLIDDIHFIAGKESTQEEFFHTFNTLYDAHKQIIISSDRSPKEINKLEERLISRFAWGLIADMQPPNLETRVAILKKKVEREPIKVPDEVIFFIAEVIKSNIRELEGALIRVVAYSLLEEREISLGMAQDVLKDMLRETKKIITVDLIQKAVADSFGLSTQDLKINKRNKSTVLARQVAMYLARELTSFSLSELGQHFGGKDHTTILYSWDKIKKALNEDGQLKNTINKLILELKQ
ncbi:MAG: chromosomal replication initiator protein DnaA [Candidatus Omnitrophota bacterium]